MPIARGVRIVFPPEMCDDFNALGDRFFARSFALRDACRTNDAFLAYFRFDVGFWDEVFAIDIFMNIDRSFRCGCACARFEWLFVFGHDSPLRICLDQYKS